MPRRGVFREVTGGTQVLDRYAVHPDVMSEKNDPNPETQPVRPTDAPADPAPVDPAPAAAAPAAAPADPAPVSAAPGQPAKRSLRDRFAGTGDRLNGTRGLIAATLAALIVGGFGGAAIHAAVDGDRHEHGRFFRGGDERPGERGDFGGFGGRMGEGERPGPRGDFFQQAPGGVPGQLPPTTTPEDGDSSPTPAPSESPSESSSS